MATVAIPVYPNHHHQSFLTQINPTATYTSVQTQLPEPTPQQETYPEDETITTVFCRALYDYEGQDESSLSFSRGEIIEVLTQQPSGWWDGLIRDERGWFPSNYVELISDEEAEQAFQALESSGSEPSLADSSMVDMTHAMMRGVSQENEEWLDDGVPSSRNGKANISGAGLSQSSDFWEPKVADNNQIYYVNTQTGQSSRYIPKEIDDEISDTEFAGLTSQTSSRSAGLAFGLNGTSEHTRMAGFGVPRRTGTPEPWVKKLADDGRSYFWVNKVDGRIAWSPPEASPSPSSQSSSSPSRLRTANGNKRRSVYSDDSDIQLLEQAHQGPLTNGHFTKPHPEPQSRPVVKKVPLPDYTTAERIARSLQQVIAPPPPELATELAAATKSAIHAVINNVQMGGSARRLEENRKLDALMQDVVLMVRNLLYLFAIPTLHIPPNLLPRGDSNTAPATSQSPLKSSQRKVTGTLFRLVISAHGLQYGSTSSTADALSRIEDEASELQKAVASFVIDVHRLEYSSSLPCPKQPKRLHGVFSTANIGPGLIGAGAAGRWKGFGWVPLDDGRVPSQNVLGSDVISELKQYTNNLNVQFQYLLHALQMTGATSVEQVRLSGRELVSLISSILGRVSDIHIARHVDIDGFQQDGGSSSGSYSQTIVTARQLVRKLEAVLQAIYNDNAVFLLAMQSMPDSELPQYRQERIQAWAHLDALSSSLKANASVLLETLSALLALGHEQAEMASGDYNGSIEWRMSRLSVRPISNYMVDDEDGLDIINMEMAFVRQPITPPKNRYQYNRPHANSDASHTLGSSSYEFDSTANTLIEDDDVKSELLDDERSLMIDEDPVLGPAKSPPRPSGSRKLEQVLGAEYVSKVAADLKPWYLRADYKAEDILIDPDNTVKGGTLPALVERLTAHDQVDPSFNQAFLMTFKSFTTVDELFDLLVARFRLEPSPELKPNELEEWRKQKKQLIQIRVINTFLAMLKDDDVLVKEDYRILDRMRAFVSSGEVSQFGAAKQVLVYIDRTIRNDNNPLKAMPQSTPPPPIFPRANNKQLKFGDIDPLELARQLTLMESNLFQKIKPMECLQRAREQKADSNDNITTIIQTSNRIADWVADYILSKEDSRKRASALKHLINVADRCRTLNNFSSMTAITSGLTRPPIHRLKRTWEQVTQRSMAQFAACESTVEGNKTFNKYRQLMSSVTPPCVPFIGVFLSTLQFIQDGNPDILPGGLVNFRKHQKASEVINEVKRWQAQPYNLQAIPSVQTYIEESLNHLNDTKALGDQFWALSLELEPREREDEKMARLLQESGFL